MEDCDEDDLDAALDWLLARRARTEKKLLAHFGNDRDGQKGLPIIVYGVLTDPATTAIPPRWPIRSGSCDSALAWSAWSWWVIGGC